MTWIARIARALVRKPAGRRTDGLLGRYLELRPELLPDSRVVFRTDGTGQSFIQTCPACRSVEFELGDWLGQSCRCRHCRAVLVPAEDGTTTVFPAETVPEALAL